MFCIFLLLLQRPPGLIRFVQFGRENNVLLLLHKVEEPLWRRRREREWVGKLLRYSDWSMNT